MENREAIEALRDLLDTTREYPHLDGMTMFGDAIETAISALEKQEVDKCCETCKHKKRSTTDWPCIDCYLSSCQVEDHYEPYTEEES